MRWYALRFVHFFFHSQCDATTYTCIQTNIYTHTASYIHLKSNNNIIVKKKIENSALIVRTFENEAPLKNEWKNKNEKQIHSYDFIRRSTIQNFTKSFSLSLNPLRFRIIVVWCNHKCLWCEMQWSNIYKQVTHCICIGGIWSVCEISYRRVWVRRNS